MPGRRWLKGWGGWVRDRRCGRGPTPRAAQPPQRRPRSSHRGVHSRLSALEIRAAVRDYQGMPAWSDWFKKRQLDNELRIQLQRLEDRPGVAGPLSVWDSLRLKTLREARDSLQTGSRIPWRVFSKLEPREQVDFKQRFPGLVEDSLWRGDPPGPLSGGPPAGSQDPMPWERRPSPFD